MTLLNKIMFLVSLVNCSHLLISMDRELLNVQKDKIALIKHISEQGLQLNKDINSMIGRVFFKVAIAPYFEEQYKKCPEKIAFLPEKDLLGVNAICDIANKMQRGQQLVISRELFKKVFKVPLSVRRNFLPQETTVDIILPWYKQSKAQQKNIILGGLCGGAATGGLFLAGASWSYSGAPVEDYVVPGIFAVVSGFVVGSLAMGIKYLVKNGEIQHFDKGTL